MKKIFLILMIFGFTSSILALTNDNYIVNDAYVEVNFDYTITNNDEETIVIKTVPFDSLTSYDDNFRINLNIINNSDYIYEYRDYSFNLIENGNNEDVFFSFDAEYNMHNLNKVLDYIDNKELGNPFFKDSFGYIERGIYSIKGIRLDMMNKEYGLVLEFKLDRVSYDTL